MAQDPYSSRQRAKRPKVRTGCRTCKIRRVKCDEERPNCRRCFSTGRICGGYELSASRDVPARAIAILPRLNSNADCQMTVALGLDADESYNFDFFRTRTMRTIPGFARFTDWEKLLLQISHREPTVLSAAVAVGSIHRSFESYRWPELGPDDIEHQKAISQRQYLKAIKLLRDLLSSGADSRKGEIALISCFLFICLELIQSDIIAAVSHLRTGLRILCELTNHRKVKPDESTVLSSTNKPDTMIEYLTIFFARLDYQSTMFGESIPRLILVPTSNTSDSKLWIPATFVDIADARQYLDTLASAVFGFRGHVVHKLAFPKTWPVLHRSLKHRWAHIMFKTPNIESMDSKLPYQQQELEEKLQTWEKTFNKLLTKNRRFFTLEENRSSKLARVHHLSLTLLLKECLSTRQKFFDQYTEEFKEMVRLTEEFSGIDPLPTFSIDMGVFGPLYYVSTKCRDSATRRKAVSLLLKCPRREAMWDGYVIGQFARQVIGLEESGLSFSGDKLTCDEVPESSRFSDITLGFSETGQKGRLYLGRFRHESDGSWVVQEIEFDFIQHPAMVRPTDELPDTLSSTDHALSTNVGFENKTFPSSPPNMISDGDGESFSLPMKSTSLYSSPRPSIAEMRSVQRARRDLQQRQSPEQPHHLPLTPRQPQDEGISLVLPLPLEDTLSYPEDVSERERSEAYPSTVGEGYPEYFGWGRHSECMSRYGKPPETVL